MKPVEIRGLFRLRYAAARVKYYAAKTPREKTRWASEMALCISELQHPQLVSLPD